MELSNDDFDKKTQEMGISDLIQPIHALDEEPGCGVISSPSGRIFLEIKSFVIDETMKLAIQKLAATTAGDEKWAAYIDGQLVVMKILMNSYEFMATRAGIERAEREANKGLDNDEDV